MGYVKDVFNTQLSINTNAHTNVLDVSGGVAVGSSYAGVQTVPTNGLLVEGNVGVRVTSATVPVRVGYNSGSSIIGMNRDDGTLHATLSVDSSNRFVLQNTSGNRGIRLWTTPATGLAYKLEFHSQGFLFFNCNDSDASGLVLTYSSSNLGNTRAQLTKVSGADAGEFLLTNAGTTTVDLRGSGLSYFNAGNVAFGQTTANATLHVNGSQALKITSVSSTPYTVLTTDSLLDVDTSVARTVTLPAAASGNTGVLYIVKDSTGSAGTNNITVKTAGGNIDGTLGTTGLAIATNYGSNSFYSNGTQWFSLPSSVGVASFATDSGSATPASNAITVTGGTNLNSSATSSTVTVHVDSAVLNLTDLTVDNLELNGNTISSTNTNGSILLAPDGTGGVGMGGSSSPDTELVIGTVSMGANGLSPACNITASAGLCGVVVGQSNTANVELYWQITSGAARMDTSALANPITINGSEVYLNTNHNPVNIGVTGETTQLFVSGPSQNWNLIVSSSDTTVEVGFLVGSSTGILGTVSNHDVGFRANDTYVGRVDTSGNWTFGNGTAPVNRLDVVGNMAVGTYATVNAAPSNGLIVSGNVGIATTSPNAALHVNGSQAGNVTTTSTSPYEILTTDYIINVDASGGAFSVVLPSAFLVSGIFYIIKDSTGSSSTNNITVTAPISGGDIDGASSYVISTDYMAVALYSNGSDWFIF